MASLFKQYKLLFPALLAIIILALVGFILSLDTKSQLAPETDLPVETLESSLPLEVVEIAPPLPTPSAQTEDIEVAAFIDSLTDSQQPVIAITKQNDQFVRHDSLISLAAPSTSVTAIDYDETITATAQNDKLVAVSDIVQSDTLPDDALFYLHWVTEEDKQGLWGVIQKGLMERFKQGIYLEGIGANNDSVKATIPADADEKLSSGFSSFLGKILHKKVYSSYIYNLDSHKMGRDPNKIIPGQQLALVHFSPEELARIYWFFADTSGQKARVFAAPH